MALQAIAGFAPGRSAAAIVLLAAPVWISGDATGGSRALPFLSPHVLVAGNAAGAASAALAGLGVEVAADGEAAGSGTAALEPGLRITRELAAAADAWSAAALRGLAGADGVTWGAELAATGAGSSAGTLGLTLDLALAMDAAGRGAIATAFRYPLPVVQQPVGGEQPGAVNLVENPSLEYVDAGLLGWSGDDLARVTDEAWSGVASAAAEGDETAPVTVMVASVAGLQIAEAGGWVGSVWLRSDVDAAVTARLAAVDGSVAIEGPDADVTLVAEGSWQRIGCGVLLAEGETADRFELRLEAALEEAGTVWLDGAQIEADTGYGTTAYLDGDAGEGYRWGGAPGASPSAREPR
jgi:hypothetical protein